MVETFRNGLETILEWIAIILMVMLTVTVLTAVFYRYTGNSLSWYDEVAEVQLAWVTYYGAALAALKRRHIGMDLVLLSIPMPVRLWLAILGEMIVLVFFVALAVIGYQVLLILEGMTLEALQWVPVQLTQSVIPIGGALYVICHLLSMPEYLRKTAEGVSLEHAEIEEEVETEMRKADAMRAAAAGRDGADGGRG